MKFSQNDMATNTRMFVLLVDRALNGTPAGQGWGAYPNLTCPQCYATHNYVALVGTKGWTCKSCSLFYPELKWQSSQRGDEGSTLWPVGWMYAEISKN